MIAGPRVAARRLAAVVLLAVFAGCAGTPPAPAAGAAAPAPAAGASAPAAAPAAAPLPPFAQVTRGAKQLDGLFTVWQRDDKVWIELKPEDFGKPLFYGPKIARGIGEAGLFGGTMIGRWPPWGRSQLVEFRKVHNLVQLVAPNTEYLAPPGTPEAIAVRAAYSPSLIGSATVVSEPHPERKSVLVEANALFLVDALAIGPALQRVYRQGYALDPRNSYFTELRGRDDALFFDVTLHFATAAIAVPQPGMNPAQVPAVPGTLPDARSLFVGVHHSLSTLPDEPMAPRRADPRIGHFTTIVQDFGSDRDPTPRVRYVNRWRLEKQDPAAPLSEPVKPITFWLDRTIPLKYRDAIRRGILEWNKAFERIGFRDAIRVEQQPDDPDFETLDIGVPSVRWMTNASQGFVALGPTQVDPRSGEILDADIVIESLAARGVRMQRTQLLSAQAGGREGDDWPALMQVAPLAAGFDAADCHAADFAAEKLAHAMDVLAARGEVDPDSPEAERFVQEALTEATMHEVGHALGLRHNFRASRAWSEAQIADPEFTRTHGLAGSIMDYTPVNLPAPGQPAGAPFQTTIGPYDYWAIEYAYRPFPAGTGAAEERAALARIGARSAEPELAFGTDEDAGFGLDPETLLFDLGNDEVAFATKRIAIARDTIARQETRVLDPERDYAVLRRSVNYALRDAARAAGILVRQIGGVRTLRDFPGSGRDPLAPLEPAVQRRALDALAGAWLAPDSFKVSPALARRLAPDYFERAEALPSGLLLPTDFTLAPIVLEVQTALLNQLMSDTMAVRVLDNEEKMPPGADRFRLAELHRRLAADIWGELDRGSAIRPARRELQREHLNRIAALLLRPEAQSRADARSLVRTEAEGLQRRLKAALVRPGLENATRAHLLDCADSLEQALKAKLPRFGI